MEIGDVVKETIRLLNEYKVPDELRAVAFTKVFDALQGTTPGWRPAGQIQSDDLLERVAVRLGTSPETVMGVFYEENGGLSLGISSSKLDSSAARATKQIALVLAAGRQAAGLDEDWTSVDTIRDVCRDFKKLDVNNFAGTITEMDDVFNFRGKGKQRAVRVAKPGWAKAKQVVESLATGGKE